MKETKDKEEPIFRHESVMASAITARQLKNNSFILRTNDDKEPTIKIGEGYFWYRGEKIEDTRKVYELFADFLIK